MVIQLETGKFYYFTSDTKDFLDFFKSPRSLDSYLTTTEAETNSSDNSQYLNDFCGFLLKNKILQQSDELSEALPESYGHVQPKFLREGEKTLDEITFLCP